MTNRCRFKTRRQRVLHALILALAIALAPSVRAGEPEPEAMPDVTDLPDFSFAGYHAGREALPDREPTIDVKEDFGAVGDGETDDSEAFQNALREAERTGGRVGIPAGRYVITQPLRITANGVGIRGAGSGQTVLVCPRPLADMIRPERRWSWSGGVLWVQPPEGVTTTVATVAETAEAGSDELTVEVAEGETIEVGEWLELQWHNDTGEDTLLDHLYGGVVPRNRMGRELQERRDPRVREWVRIEAIEGRTITIQQPLRIDARTEWQPTLVRRPSIREVGIEGLAIEFPGTPYPGHLRERGYNAVYLLDAINCWVRDLRIIHADSGVFVDRSRYCTVRDVAMSGRRMHHPLSMSWSSDCLMTDWEIDAPHVHGTTLSWAAHGNVYSRGRARDLAMDCHRAASFENLHTDITITYANPDRVNPFRSGGSAPRGPHSARRNVYWNIALEFAAESDRPVDVVGHNEWPLGIFVGWHGNRPLRFRPIDGMGQQVLDLNRRPEIENLHLDQARRRDRR